MKTTIGNTAIFAVDIEISKFYPFLWGKSCIWINGIQIGLYEDENIMGPFFQAFWYLTKHPQEFIIETIKAEACDELFEQLNPFFNNDEGLLELVGDEYEKIVELHKVNLFFGENFDRYYICALNRNDIFRFVWINHYETQLDKPLVHCFNIRYIEIKNIFNSLCNMIPDEYRTEKLKPL